MPYSPETESDSDSYSPSPLTWALMAGSMALPWLGKLGQPAKKAVRPTHTNLQDLLNEAQVGDIVVSGLRDEGFFDRKGGGLKNNLLWGLKAGTHPKSLISIPFGEPKFYHTDAVIGKKPGATRIAYLSSEGLKAGDNAAAWSEDPRRHYVLLRPGNMTTEQHGEYLRNIGTLGAAAEKGAGPEAFDMYGGVISGMLRRGAVEGFVPKIGVRDDAAARERIRTQLQGIACGTPGASKDLGACISPIAAALPNGIHVVPGKHLDDLAPPDLLRSKYMNIVGAVTPSGDSTHEKFLRAAPTVARLGLGSMGALAAYNYGKKHDTEARDERKRKRIREGLRTMSAPVQRPS